MAPAPPPQSTDHANRSFSDLPPAACSRRLPSTHAGIPQISENTIPLAQIQALSLNHCQFRLSLANTRPARQAKRPPATTIPSSVPANQRSR